MARRYKNPGGTLKFVLIAAIMMIVADFIFVPFHRIYNPPEPTEPVESIAAQQVPSEIADADREWADIAARETEEYNVTEPFGPRAAPALSRPMQSPSTLNLERKIVETPLAPPPVYDGKGAKIAIIIDDMGLDRKRSHAIMDLSAPLTLAFLPYAPKLPAITAEARSKGHELMIHIPMQPQDKTLDPGPLALRDDMTEAAFDLALAQMFESFDGYVGVNNHMGSRLTQNEAAMRHVMEALKDRGLFFVDSKTISSSVAVPVAMDIHLPHAARDIFLDNINTKDAVLGNLRRLEVIARRRGHAIAIGHPRDGTIEALTSWIADAKSRGFIIVPVSALTQKP